MISKTKDPLQAIKQALDSPIEAVEPTQFDDAAIARSIAARYSNPTLKDELVKGEIQNEPESD